jgi:putative SOS response-associated peptidase YedK
MCGRYANFRRDSDLIDTFQVQDVRDPELEPS